MKPRDFERSLRGLPDSALKLSTPNAQMIMIPASAIRTSPAAALATTDSGPVLVLSPAVLLGRTARDIRMAGLIVSASIPDDAEVIRDEIGRTVFRWVAVQP